LAPDVPAVELLSGEEFFAVLHRAWRCVAARSLALRPPAAQCQHCGSPAGEYSSTLNHSASADACAAPAAHKFRLSLTGSVCNHRGSCLLARVLWTVPRLCLCHFRKATSGESSYDVWWEIRLSALKLQNRYNLQMIYASALAAPGDNGRVVLRYSGTEQLARVMVEAEHEVDVQRFTQSLANALRSSIGA
jgi:hypothetical protein